MADVSWPVRAFKIVDLPTEGKPTRPTVALPDFFTAKLRPPPPPEEACFSACAFRAAIFALSFPMWNSVALFFCVLKISASISLIWSAMVPKEASVLARNAGYKRDRGGARVFFPGAARGNHELHGLHEAGLRAVRGIRAIRGSRS
ncbi:MAG: hypothetical protein ABR562_05120 [Thermoplasmatota archaeon]